MCFSSNVSQMLEDLNSLLSETKKPTLSFGPKDLLEPVRSGSVRHFEPVLSGSGHGKNQFARPRA